MTHPLAAHRVGIPAAPAQVEEAIRVNTESRLRALKIGLLIMACISLLVIIPAGRLPNYRPGEIPANPPPRTVPPEEIEKGFAADHERAGGQA
jgi:hypothetical protein